MVKNAPQASIYCAMCFRAAINPLSCVRFPPDSSSRSVRYFPTVLLFSCFLLAAGGWHLYAIHPDSLRLLPPSPAPQVLVSLKSGWQEESEKRDKPVLTTPFVWESRAEITLSRVLGLPDSLLKDTLYLYFDGIAWQASLEIDDRFLGIHDSPHQPWIIPVPAHWLDSATLRLRLSLPADNTGRAPLFLGIYRPAWILDSAQLAAIRHRRMPGTQNADSVAVWAPFNPRTKYVFDPFSAAKIALPLLERGVRHIHFAFEPGFQLREFCRRLGFVEVQEMTPNMVICYVNDFPGYPERIRRRCWLGPAGARTLNDGLWYRSTVMSDFDADAPSSGWMLAFLLVPLAGLFALKLIQPQFLSDTLAALSRPRQYIDLLHSRYNANKGFMAILGGMNLVCAGFFLVIAFWYLEESGRWENVSQWVSKHSLIYQLFAGPHGIWTLCFRVLCVLALIWAYKQAVLLLLGRVMGGKGVRAGVSGIEMLSAAPLIWAMPLAAILMTMFPASLAGIYSIILLFGLIAWMILRVYVGVLGVDKLFAFSAGGKLLYICALHLLPYFIWL